MIDLQLLGGLGVECSDLSANARTRRRHSMAALALCAAFAPQPLAREKVMAFLWPESDTERASNSLRQTLFWLRRDLGDDLFLPESASGIQLDPSRLRVDLWLFREALERRDFASAVDAYAGPFLDGFQLPGASEFSQWVEAERARLERQYTAALEALALRAEEEARHNDAVMWRRRRASVEPYSSRAALGLLRSLVAAGDRPGALEYAGVYESLVRQHLDTEPDPAVREYVNSLRHEALVRSAPTAQATALQALPAARLAPPPLQRSVRRRRSPGAWLVAGSVFVVASILGGRTLVGGSAEKLSPAAEAVIVLASGAVQVAARDTASSLVECTGPACPSGSLPQPAWVVPKHGAYAMPVAGSNFIAPPPDGTTGMSPGYKCCTVAAFENTFRLPANAVSARISVTVLADNQAGVAINGVSFGVQPDRWAAENYSGPATTFTTTFLPDPTGSNRLRVTLWDGGGAIGLQYHATVTYVAADGAASSR